MYNKENIIGEIFEDNIYYRATELIGYTNNKGDRYYYRHNSHGDVTAILDIQGNEKKTYSYNAYGKETQFILNPMGNQTAILQWRAETEQVYNPFRYAGEYYDQETRLIYLRNRYYDNSIGRFISQDTHWNINNIIYGDKEYKEGEIKFPNINAILQTNNLYVYCINNPIRYVDKSGNEAGDFFITEEQAAIDFAKIYNPKSIKENAEYGAYIYSFIGIAEIDGKAKITTFYSYGTPVKGEEKSISVASFSEVPYKDAKKIAIIHTHGRYSKECGDENFPGIDVDSTRIANLDRIYLATPGGYLKVINVKSLSVKKIANIPFDYKSPAKAWWRKGGIRYE